MKINGEFTRVVFAAMSKRNFFLREHIVKFVLQKGYTPSCAFMMYSYFLLDTVDRQSLISANNALITRSDELWVFGEISDGVTEEVKLERSLNLPVKYFDICIDPACDFVEINEKDIVVENVI